MSIYKMLKSLLNKQNMKVNFPYIIPLTKVWIWTNNQHNSSWSVHADVANATMVES